MTPLESIQEINEQKKEYLRSYRAAVKREERILEDIQELRASKAFPAAISYDGMPKGSNQSDLSDYIAILDRMIENLKSERLEKVKRREQIEKSIKDIQDDNEREVLRLRYIDGKKWEEICIEMGYSWQWIHKIHSRALKNLKVAIESDYTSMV